MPNTAPLKIIVRPATNFGHEKETGLFPCYSTTSKNRGLVKIINIDTIEREGSQHDVRNLCYLFRQIGFEVDVNDHITTVESFKLAIVALFQDDRLKTADICILVIMSHGKQIDGKDHLAFLCGDTILLNDIERELNNCPLMLGKPKLLFFQICRQSSDDMPSSNATSFCLYTSNADQTIFADLLIGHATGPSNLAYRETQAGSWFIYALCAVFMQHSADYDVATLLTVVYDQVRHTRDAFDADEVCQTGEYLARSFDRCYLNPGIYRDETTQCIRSFSPVILPIARADTTKSDTHNQFSGRRTVEDIMAAKIMVGMDREITALTKLQQSEHAVGPDMLLHHAVQEGLIGTSRVLLRRGADVNARDDLQRTPLHWAVEKGFKFITEVLIEYNANVNALDRMGVPPLFLIFANGDHVQRRHIEIVKMLVSKGADVNYNDAGCRNSPLHLAVFHHNAEIIKLLVDNGARVDIKNMYGITPEDDARKIGDHEIIAYLQNIYR